MAAFFLTELLFLALFDALVLPHPLFISSIVSFPSAFISICIFCFMLNCVFYGCCVKNVELTESIEQNRSAMQNSLSNY